MKIRTIWVCCMLLQGSAGYAQQHQIKAWVLPEAGIMIGATEPAADLRLQAGIAQGKWLFGVGASLDYYRFKSYPVYAQVRRVFGFRQTSPFLIASAGYNLKQSSDTVATWIGSQVYQRTGGYYAEFGGGFILRVFKKERLFLSVVNSLKQVKESYDRDFWLGPGQTRTATSSDLYTMQRVVIRVGWKF